MRRVRRCDGPDARQIGRASCRERGYIGDWSSDVCSSDLARRPRSGCRPYGRLPPLPDGLHPARSPAGRVARLSIRPGRSPGHARGARRRLQRLGCDAYADATDRTRGRSEERRVGNEGTSVTGVQTCALPISLGGLVAAAALTVGFLLYRMASTPPAPPQGESRAFQFVLVAPRATHVELVGDFNDWDATRTPMRRTGREADRKSVV